MAVETNAAVIRHTARIKVFGAVQRGDALQPVLEHYICNENAIVPLSVRRWAERVKTDPNVAVRDEVVTLYSRDMKIAERFKEGVEIGGEIVSLSGLIRREQNALKKFQKPL